MGLRHGDHCLGCYWLLMAVLFVVGVMAAPAKWSGLDAFAFAVEVKRVAEIQYDFVAGAKS
jgi:predicted metal-binding membrane protein